MKNFTNALFVLLAVYLYMVEANVLTAQTNNYTMEQSEQLTNFEKEHRVELDLLTNYAKNHGITVQEVISSPKYYMDYQSNAYFQIHGVTESEMMSNAVRHAQSVPSPSDSQTGKALEHGANLLNSAFESNQIEWVCTNIFTNFPAIRRMDNQPSKDGPIIVTYLTNKSIILNLENISSQITSNLGWVADNFTSKTQKIYLGGTGYQADIPVNDGIFYCFFWDEKGIVKKLEKRTSDAKYVTMYANFYQNGKLQEFRLIQPNEGIGFDADGKFNSFWIVQNHATLDLRPDKTGNIKVRNFILNQ
jgi:hypothetical protein